jgi:hypothetical protein
MGSVLVPPAATTPKSSIDGLTLRSIVSPMDNVEIDARFTSAWPSGAPRAVESKNCNRPRLVPKGPSNEPRAMKVPSIAAVAPLPDSCA